MTKQAVAVHVAVGVALLQKMIKKLGKELQ